MVYGPTRSAPGHGRAVKENCGRTEASPGQLSMCCTARGMICPILMIDTRPTRRYRVTVLTRPKRNSKSKVSKRLHLPALMMRRALNRRPDATAYGTDPAQAQFEIQGEQMIASCPI